MASPIQASRDSRWEADGVKPLPLPEGIAMISARGGTLLAGPSHGDDVELYTDAGKGKGEWAAGFVALSNVKQGAIGGPYDGQDVVWVGKPGAESVQPPEGQEWPAQFVRLAKTDEKTTYQDTPTEGEDGSAGFSFGEEPDADTITTISSVPYDGEKVSYMGAYATFYDPLQRRGFHGMWVDEGKGRRYVREFAPVEGNEGHDMGVNPMQKNKGGIEKGAVSPRSEAKVPNVLGKYDTTQESMDQRVLEMASRIDPENAEVWRKWYYDAADLAEEMAANTNTSMTVASIGIAAMSPHALWGNPNQYGKKIGGNTNQNLAYRILDLVGNHGDDEIDITPDMVKAMNDPELSRKKRIDAESYNGTDISRHDDGTPIFPPGTNYAGKRKLKELPADILYHVKSDVIHAMTDNSIKAIQGARYGNPEVLGGPKTRSFYNDIRFPETAEDATMDAFMVRVVTGHRDLMGEELSDLTKSPSVYRAMANSVINAAHDMGWQPHELQAALWMQEHLEVAQLTNPSLTSASSAKQIQDAATLYYKRAIVARMGRIDAERAKNGLKPIQWEDVKEGKKVIVKAARQPSTWMGRFLQNGI